MTTAAYSLTPVRDQGGLWRKMGVVPPEKRRVAKFDSPVAAKPQMVATKFAK